MNCVRMRIATLWILLVFARVSIGDDSNATLPEEVRGEDAAIGSEESAQDLSSQLQQVDVDTRSSEWTAWSQWSSCSRSCDGGVSHQLRRCLSAGCRGDHVRYKICNMQPCPESREFREDQCAAFNSIHYEGTLFMWTPHYDDEDPCALTCRGAPVGSDETLSDEPVLVVARLADRVQDGTRCRPGSLDMCIDGKCQRVGCDLKIGSERQVDACGVCGGDGSSCSRPLYHWTLTTMSLCSATCGGGYKMSRPLCLNRVTGEEADEPLCNASQKPDPAIVPCNTHNCPPKWHAGEWGTCSVSCGGGSRLRQVHCVEEANNTKIRVNEERCSGHKPRYQEACNQMDCPKWHTFPWSGCSVSCGEGVQVRGVECRDAQDRPSVLCPEHKKPTTTNPCSTGIQCPYQVDSSSEELLPGLYHTQPLVQPYPPPPPAHAERLVGEQVVPSESTFIPEEWGPCSVTCGEGVRRREVHCKIFLEFSRTIAKLPDKQCSGPKPIETERCMMEPCSSERIDVDIKDDPYRSDPSIKVGNGAPGKSYSWKEQGYTHCSATCLGGVQELIVNCVRDDTQKVTSPYLCPRELKPEILIRTCNDHPCPPRWNFSEFQPCTQSCGIGIRTREVNCIHEVTQGGGNTVIVPNNMCPQPPPPDRQYCNVLDCPVRWKVSEWSKCSRTCGGGEKTRKVECKQVMAQNHTVDRPVSLCPTPRPLEKKPCNTKSCVLESDKPHIDVSNSTFIQHDPKRKKISLKVGGAATVFYGTTIKIKCPVKRFNRTKIQWLKDYNNLPKGKKYKTSKKGALRVQNLIYRDSGVYTCIAGRSSANLTVSVRPRPGEFLTSEEIQKQVFNKNDFEIADFQPNRDDAHPMFSSDDQSHEQRPDAPRKKPTARTKTFAVPTAPSPKSDSSINKFNALYPHTTGTHYDQTFSNSRGHRMVAFPDDPFGGVDFGREGGAAALARSGANDNDDDDDDEGSVVILGKGSPENLKFDWLMTDWSRCSLSCGDEGLQVRVVQCVVKLHNNTQDVDSNLCEDAGLETPLTIRKCAGDECPKWSVTEWSPCEKSKCFALNTAMQRREVRCQTANETFIEPSKCDQSDRPPHRQECHNEKCVGRWKAGPWSECAAACEMQGVKYRILQCVWYGTKKPAPMACKNQTRPIAMKSCKGPPCDMSDSECEDHSMFCPNVKTMNMCKVMRYQQQCCQTCSKG